MDSLTRPVYQDAEKVRQRKKTVIWFVSFVWLNETYQMNQINQINKTNRSTRRATLDEDGLFEHPAWRAPVVLDMRAIEFPLCHNSFPPAC
jgi:hypothetical protein